ncbi:McrC family protein [Paenibacillus woosongensis]|nr:McrC family protein [Paenibacillus woosongensis]
MDLSINAFNNRRGGTYITLKEYGTLCKNPNGVSLGYHCMPELAFDRLERFVLEHKGPGHLTDALELMTLASRKGVGKTISAKNYVGVISMADGTQIEILPKVYARDEESSIVQTKSIFLHMLKSIRDIPNKPFNMAGLGTANHHLLDIFIRMFIEEAVALVKHGLKSDYREHRDNEPFFKGKLQFAQHIKHNAGHKERFFVEYDEYNMNRAENRLIKATIGLLMKVSRNTRNQKDLYALLTAFDNIDTSMQLEKDWASVTTDRTMKEYQAILAWCRLFLSGQSFTPFRGQSAAYALLFPMDKIFERYVAGLLKKGLGQSPVQVKTQDRTHRLFQNPARFQLKPDIVVQGPGGVIVLDTKWKLLSPSPDYGISQADMYQAYAYGKKYSASEVYLLYPWNPRLSDITQPVVYDSGDGVQVRIEFLDLTLGKASVDTLLAKLSDTIGTKK